MTKYKEGNTLPLLDKTIQIAQLYVSEIPGMDLGNEGGVKFPSVLKNDLIRKNSRPEKGLPILSFTEKNVHF